MVSLAPLDIPADETGHVEWAGFIGDVPAFAGANGLIHLVAGGVTRIVAHDGLLAACLSQDGASLLAAGEDGRVTSTGANGTVLERHSAPGKWIDQIAAGPSGAIAFSWGRHGCVLTRDGARPFECERTVEGLAFAPKGMRLALARYNGIELRWIATGNPPQFLEWKGAHTGVTFSPDGKYAVTTMQENALHGWRLADGRHMRMTGYPAKVRSLSWSPKGRWLASSGAPAAIVWPFAGKDGPMGKAPKELGSMGNRLVTTVACHPHEDMVAIGYEDGLVLAVRIDDGKEATLRRGGAGAVSTLGWDAAGRRLAFGTEAGEAGIVDLGG